jgi:hypothetical protein
MTFLVIYTLKVILIQIIQITSNVENHFYINIFKHKSILFNSLLTKINYVKLNSTKINYSRRQTKHILSHYMDGLRGSNIKSIKKCE